MKPPAEDVLFKLITTDREMAQWVEARIYPDVAPNEQAGDWVVYTRISGAEADATSHDGFDDLTEPIYQVTFWSKDAMRRKLARGVLLKIFRMKRIDFNGTDVVLAVTGDRNLTDDGPPRHYGAAVDVQISL